MGLVDYHTHTPLCGHAVGSPDDYVMAAAASGLAEIGFSDHAPLPEHLREGITMTESQTESYLSLIESTRRNAGEKIKVRTGFEVDYPLHPSFDARYFTDPRIDYLIGSCHFIDEWPFDHPDYIEEYSNRDIDEIYKRYYELLAGLILAGKFNIVGHLDLVKKFGHRPRRSFSGEIRALFRSMVHGDMAVEINTAGLRKPVKEMYPSREIVGELFNLNVPMTLGSDAHTPEEVGYEFIKAVEMLKSAGYRKISGFEKRKRFDITL